MVIVKNKFNFKVNIIQFVEPSRRIEQAPDGTALNENEYIPSQAFLTTLIQIFPTIFTNIKNRYIQIISAII